MSTSPALSSHKRHRGTALAIVLRLVVGLMLLTAICWSIDLRMVASNFTSLQPTLFGLLSIVAVSDRVLMAYKWNLLLRRRGISISLWQATRLYYIGHLMGTFTPGAIGADAYRVVALSRFEETEKVISTVLLERLIGFAVVAIFAAVGLPVSLRYLSIENNWLVWTITFGGVLGVLAIFLSLYPPAVRYLSRPFVYLINIRVLRRLKKFYLSYAEYRKHWPTLLAFALLTVIEVIVSISVSYLAAKSLGIGVSFGYFIGVMPLLYLLIRLPISFQGIGIQEGVFAFLLLAAGFSAADGLAISLLLRVVEVLLGFLPAAVMLWLGSFNISPNSND